MTCAEYIGPDTIMPDAHCSPAGPAPMNGYPNGLFQERQINNREEEKTMSEGVYDTIIIGEDRLEQQPRSMPPEKS